VTAEVGRPASSVTTIATIGRRPRRVALVGNPNVGKSSLFNALTGLQQKVSNYPGTTVERIVGKLQVPGGAMEVVDLPGSYSLLPRSPDEAVVRDELLGRVAGDPRPDVVVIVLDATNLERNLFLATQVLDLGLAVVVALNQCDLALARGLRVDPERLSEALGVPVVPTCGRTRQGRDALASAIASGGRRGKPFPIVWPRAVTEAADELRARLSDLAGPGAVVPSVETALGSEAAATEVLDALARAGRGDDAEALRAARGRLGAMGADTASGAAAARYDAIERLLPGVVEDPRRGGDWQRALDSFLTHPVLGSLTLLLVFAGVFSAIFTGCEPLIGLVEGVIDFVGGRAEALGGDGLLGDFLRNGVVMGFGNFLVFIPQIAVFFVLIEVLDDTGYLARAAYLLDRVMGKAGLPGRAFLPLLSGFACAIPGIMATKTISDVRDRMVTMFVLPLMSCSARLPVYLLVISAVFAGAAWWVAPAVIVSMYLLGIGVALAAASVLRRTVFRGGRTPLLLELPPYRRPSVRTVSRNVARRTWAFVSGAGPIIFVLTIGLWGLMAFPRDVPLSRDYDAMIAAARADAAGMGDGRGSAIDAEILTDRIASLERERVAERQAGSYLGRMGKAIEPAIEPLGFDWKMGVGILASFAAREVFVPTLGVIYAVGDDADEESETLREHMRRDRWPGTGRPVYTPLAAISLLVFYVLALQCMSTLAVLRRETGSWKGPLLLFGGLTVLAYLASLVVYQAGSALGF